METENKISKLGVAGLIGLVASILTIVGFTTGKDGPEFFSTPQPVQTPAFYTPAPTPEVTPTPYHEDTTQAGHQSSNAYQELLDKCLLFDSSLELPFEAEMLAGIMQIVLPQVEQFLMPAEKKTRRSPRRAPFRCFRDRFSQPHTKEIVVVLALRRGLIGDIVLIGQHDRQRLCRHSPGVIVIQTENDFLDAGMIFEILRQRQRGRAFLQFLSRAIDPCQRYHVIGSPVHVRLLAKGSIGKQVYGALKQVQGVTALRCGDTERETLVAAAGLTLEVRTDPAQVGVAGLAVLVQPDEHDIVVLLAFIEPPGGKAEVQQIAVDAAPGQIVHRMGRTAACLRQTQGLCLLHLWRRLRGRRRDRAPAYDDLHGLHKGDALDLYEIIQGGAPADATGEPVPFAVGDFEAVMLTGTVGASPKMHQLLRLIGFEVGV